MTPAPGLSLLPSPLAAAAAFAGVSRIGDVTRLDRLGVPVWQAVRPASRTISVHQGKALDNGTAAIAAAMEAVETHAAENPGPTSVHASWSRLSALQRSPAADDFARVRGGIDPDQPLDWMMAEQLDGRPAMHVPRAAVALDFTCATLAPAVETTSNGQGAHFDLAAASLKGLLEIVERDAVTEAFAADPHFWRLGRVTVPIGQWPWFDRIATAAAAAGISLWLYHLRGIGGIPVMACEMRQAGASPAPLALALGTAAGPNFEAALRGAVTEAAQVRITNIAYAREDLSAPDCLPQLMPVPPMLGIAPTLPVSAKLARSENAKVALRRISRLVRAAGYRDILRIRLPSGDPGVHIVRMMVPGLAAGQRRRRAPE